MITIRDELPTDLAPREALLNRSLGVKRFRKTSERIRDGRVPAEGLSFTAVDAKGKIVGTVRLWNIIAGSAGPSLLLGPLAVEARLRGQGVGKALIQRALNSARVLGHESVLLVGNAPYYSRFGFDAKFTRSLHMPGPVERDRFMGIELVEGALDGAEGLVSASGTLAPASNKKAAA